MKAINDKYQLIKHIGSGGFGKVYLANDLINNRQVAIKVVKLTQSTTSKTKMVHRLTLEVETMSALYHHNIVQFYDLIKKPNCWYIVMEYCNGGTLKEVIESNLIGETIAHFYLSQLREALFHIEKKRYLHRDIKPSNLLLLKSSSSIVLKLADFGLAQPMDAAHLADTLGGSPLYMAPELLFNHQTNDKSDLWSVGVLLYQLLTGKHPYPASTYDQLLKLKDLHFDYSSSWSTNCYHLVTHLLTKDPSNRLHWIDFFNHPWFNCSIVNEYSRFKLSKPIVIDSSKKCFKPTNVTTTESNLSKMKLTDNVWTNIVPGDYFNYPMFYPAEEKCRKLLFSTATRATDDVHAIDLIINDY